MTRTELTAARIDASRKHARSLKRWERARATKTWGPLGAERYQQATLDMRRTYRAREAAYGRA